MNKNRIDHNSNDFISISDINTTDRYRILLRFSWYGLEIILISICFIQKIKKNTSFEKQMKKRSYYDIKI